MENLMFRLTIAFLVLLFGTMPCSYLPADRKDVTNDPVFPGIPLTYGEAVEQYCEQYVFPDRLEYKGIGVHRDNCIAEKVERDGNSWWFTCRARYSGRIGFVGVAERARIHYDNGQVRVDLGGLKGVLNTEAATNWLKQANPFGKESEYQGSDKRRFDAAVEHPNGNVYFFAEEYYFRFDAQTDRFDKKAKIGHGGWWGVPSDVDAAIFHPIQKKAHLFKGSKYYRYNFEMDKVDKVGEIDQEGWRGVWRDGVDGAIVHPLNGKGYFFKGNEYQRFDFMADKVDKKGVIDDNGWKGVWTNGIDAAVEFNGFGYLFQGDKYKKYDFTKGIDKVIKNGTFGKTGWLGGGGL